MAASKNPLARLAHIRDEIEQLAVALDGIEFDVFSGSYVLRRMTEHAILIISEAVKSLPSATTEPRPGIDWRAIRNIGNVLRHDYFEVDVRVLWKVATEHLRELKPVIDRMIEEHGG